MAPADRSPAIVRCPIRALFGGLQLDQLLMQILQRPRREHVEFGVELRMAPATAKRTLAGIVTGRQSAQGAHGGLLARDMDEWVELEEVQRIGMADALDLGCGEAIHL